jgi:hypothetical protein
MDERLTKHDMLCDTMFRMFKNNTLPYLDMEDFVIMWQSLAERWDIYLEEDQWEEFTEEVNSMASNRLAVFEEIFDKYFNN